MLDTTTALLPTMTPAWRDHVAVGDIVSYRFPCATDQDTTPKTRPCLVLDVETINGQRYALLAYGTTATTGANRGYEIRVRSADALASAGLHKPTRFVAARRLLVPLESAGFACSAATGAPVLGRLTGETRERMHAVRARIHAERDIAADRRASRRRAGSRRWSAPRPVVVEIRRTKRQAVRSGEAS